MSQRRIESAIGGFLLLLFLSLIGWNLALSYDLRLEIVMLLFIAIFGFFFLGIIMMPDER